MGMGAVAWVWVTNSQPARNDHDVVSYLSFAVSLYMKCTLCHRFSKAMFG